MKIPQLLMLIPFLKKLMVETSAEAFHKACKILDQNGIQYRIQTIRLRGIIGTGLESSSYMRFNVSQNKWGFTISNFLCDLRSSQRLRKSPPVDRLNQNGISRSALVALLQSRALR